MGNAQPETQLISVRWTLPTLLMMNYLKANLISNFRLPTPVRAGLETRPYRLPTPFKLATFVKLRRAASTNWLTRIGSTGCSRRP